MAFNAQAYLAFTKTSFLNKLVYRADYLFGVLNTCIQLFIACLIWKTLYGSDISIDGITISMVVTTITISQGLSNAYFINDEIISKKVKDGSIAYTLLKPISFRAQILAEALGEILFRLLFNFLPVIIIFTLYTDILPPHSIAAIPLFILSVILGFTVLWTMSSIVQHSAFWLMNVWSLSTIKNVLITLFSGSLLPLWFMPAKIQQWVEFTPFGAIYFIPARIYLGDIEPIDAFGYFSKQMAWIIIMFMISHIMWVKGKQSIVIQGG